MEILEGYRDRDGGEVSVLGTDPRRAGRPWRARIGIAASSLPRSAARNGVAVVTLPFVVLQFISGVYVPFTLVPPWLQDIASVFPLEWMCRGMRSVFIPQAVSLEPAHSWQHGQTALVLMAWIVAGLVLCLKTFRWRSRTAR